MLFFTWGVQVTCLSSIAVCTSHWQYLTMSCDQTDIVFTWGVQVKCLSSVAVCTLHWQYLTKSCDQTDIVFYMGCASEMPEQSGCLHIALAVPVDELRPD